MSHLSQPVQIVLMYDNGPAFDRHFSDLAALAPRLCHALRGHEAFQSLPGYNTPDQLGLGGQRRHITLERFDQPMAMRGFGDVLSNPLVINGKPALAQAIMEHQRAFLIQVGTGSVPGFSSVLAESGLMEELGGLDDFGGGFKDDQDRFENRLHLAQEVALAMIREMMPSAVHWGQSQQVFDGPSFSNLAAEGFSLPLYCGPYLFGGEQMPDGSVKAGIRLLGSQHILGKMVIFAPDVQDWADSMVQMLTFVAYCRSLGRILGDGETMSSDANDSAVIRVTHKNDIPQLPDGYVELSVDRRSQAEKPPKIKVHADTATVQAAMHGDRGSKAGKPPKMTIRADTAKVQATMQNDRKDLTYKSKGAKPGLFGRIFGRKK